MKNEFNPEKLQAERNQALLDSCRYMHSETVSSVPPLQLDIAGLSRLSEDDITLFEALQIDAARIAISAVASLSKLNEVDHMGGGLDMIPPLLLTLSLVDRAYILIDGTVIKEGSVDDIVSDPVVRSRYLTEDFHM